MKKLTNNSPKKIGRRKFCACITAGSLVAGMPILAGCSGNNSTDPGLSSKVTLTTAQVTDLKNKGYLNYSGGEGSFVIFYNNNNYKAFTAVCPHEEGKIEAKSSTSAQCQKHMGQTFDINNNAKGNGHETSANLTSYTATKNTDGTVTIS